MLIVELECLKYKTYKSAPIVALYWLLKRLLTYWFMSDVLPTLKRCQQGSSMYITLCKAHPLSPRMITFENGQYRGRRQWDWSYFEKNTTHCRVEIIRKTLNKILANENGEFGERVARAAGATKASLLVREADILNLALRYALASHSQHPN